MDEQGHDEHWYQQIRREETPYQAADNDEEEPVKHRRPTVEFSGNENEFIEIVIDRQDATRLAEALLATNRGWEIDLALRVARKDNPKAYIDDDGVFIY